MAGAKHTDSNRNTKAHPRSTTSANNTTKLQKTEHITQNFKVPKDKLGKSKQSHAKWFKCNICHVNFTSLSSSLHHQETHHKKFKPAKKFASERSSKSNNVSALKTRVSAGVHPRETLHRRISKNPGLWADKYVQVAEAHDSRIKEYCQGVKTYKIRSILPQILKNRIVPIQPSPSCRKVGKTLRRLFPKILDLRNTLHQLELNSEEVKKARKYFIQSTIAEPKHKSLNHESLINGPELRVKLHRVDMTHNHHPDLQKLPNLNGNNKELRVRLQRIADQGQGKLLNAKAVNKKQLVQLNRIDSSDEALCKLHKLDPNRQLRVELQHLPYQVLQNIPNSNTRVCNSQKSDNLCKKFCRIY